MLVIKSIIAFPIEGIQGSSFDEVDNQNIELSEYEVLGTGTIAIKNTGGSSAAERGMGSGGAEKGPGIKDPNSADDKQDGNSSIGSNDVESWDPLKPKEEKEKH